ncbi:MAG: hypothetical protein J5771_06120 [Bacteroidales bacterium]|nr:hypothetical protein [Bacteroidales bacterium]
MKKLALFIGIFIAAVSCATSGELLKTTSSYQKVENPIIVVTPLQADLDVSTKKVDYFMPVDASVAAGGVDNVISTAVREVLAKYGYDVLVGIQTQLTYNSQNVITQVRVSGYPARYINFRNCDSIPIQTVLKKNGESSKVSIFSKGK